MKVQLSRPLRRLSGKVRLPASKSISNRVLVIRALCPEQFPVYNLSDSDDTRAMEKALAQENSHIDVGNAGTAMRFLTALFASRQDRVTLDGSERMRLRPVGPLVDALRSLGADIRYAGNEGFPPLGIFPAPLRGGTIGIDASLSSQYISSLMMIAPLLPGGMVLQAQGEQVSEPYIAMTEKLMAEFGVTVQRVGSSIVVPQESYRALPYEVEADWSAAAFWYEWIALSETGSELVLHDLRLSGLQGDQAAESLFRFAGVETENTAGGIVIRKTDAVLPDEIQLDLLRFPDLAPAIAATVAGLKIRGKITGLRTLVIKESNRIEALRNELEKTGAEIGTGPDHIEFKSYDKHVSSIPEVLTYDDHRIAMCMTPLVTLAGSLTIDEPQVVSKSYPRFWEEAANFCTQEWK